MSITALPPAPQTTDPANFDVRADALIAALPTFVNECNATAAAMNFNSTNGTSASSVLIGTGSKTFTADTGKSWQLGMTLRIASTATPTNFMTGEVTAYNSGTGSLTVNVVSTSGSGTIASWTISQAGVSLGAPVLDLTGYTGADVSLLIGQSAIYTVTAATSLLLRIATGDNQRYELEHMPDIAAAVAGTPAVLLPNNAVTGAGAIAYCYIRNDQATPTGNSTTNNAFLLDFSGTPFNVNARICTRTKGKTVSAISGGSTNTTNLTGVDVGRWSDTTTVWSSLGTINWSQAWSGLLQVTRKL